MRFTIKHVPKEAMGLMRRDKAGKFIPPKLDLTDNYTFEVEECTKEQGKKIFDFLKGMCASD